MTPGTWAQLVVPNQNAILGVGVGSGTMLPYCNSMPWNPISKVVEIIGMDHNYPHLRHVRYDEATNLYVLVADNAGIGPHHGYDHNVVNPYNGDLYNCAGGGFTGAIQSRKKAYGASSFTAIPSVPGLEQNAIGVCWWSGSFTGAGAQGCYMIFNSGNSLGNANDGQIVAYNPLTNTWFYSQEGMAPFYGIPGVLQTYHSVMEYSPVHNVAVYGGGNDAPTKLWRISSNRSMLAMPNTPAGKTVGIQRGLLVDDPVTGNFLLTSADELWELNPSGSGTWTQQTGSRVPPASVGMGLDAVICSAIPDYGVVMYITQPTQINGTTYLYKHA